MEYLNCLDSSPNLLGIFDTTIAPNLLYYSYLPIVFISIFFGFIVFNKKTSHLLRNRILIFIILSFSLFIINEIVQWIAVPTSLVHFGWELAPLFQTIILLLSLYFVLVFINQKDIDMNYKVSIALFALPVLLFLPTSLNMISFDLENCQSNIGPLFIYVYALQIISVFLILYVCRIKYYKTNDILIKKQILYIMFGSVAFLSILFASNILGEFTKIYEINLIGPVGMFVFLLFLAYMTVKFQAFSVKIMATQALIWALAFMIGAQFFFIKTNINFVLNSFTFVAALFFGQLLILSVKREVDQSEELRIDTESLYSKNLEITTVNKTLSLLRKLYQISLLTIDPDSLSKKISDEVRVDLNLEFVGILGFDEASDTLSPFNFSKSERLANAMKEKGFLFKDFKISGIKDKPFLKESVYGKVSVTTEKLEDIWGGAIDSDKLKLISESSHMKTALLYPLTAETKLIGLLLIGLNRSYGTLTEHEKESIKSCIDVIAVALDKAYLYKELQDANARLKQLITQRESLVHLITHKVKGSFTRSKFLFAEMLEGSFGPLSDRLNGMVKRGFDSDVEGIATIDLVLNSANLQNGTVKYDMKSTDFKDLVSKLFTEKKVSAEAKGLKMEIDMQEGEYVLSGDAFWLKEVIVNLFENSIRYTKEGSIKVGLKKNGTKILFSVIDTGVGITDEDKKHLFTEGGRGKDSVKMNVDSTGYGLFSVKLIVESHKGRIWAESEGQDKGSAFYVEFDSLK